MTNEELVEQIQSGIDVKNNMGLLYQQNYNFIYKLALPYSEFVEMADLMQESYFGLEKAVKKFDLDLDIKFLTFASYHIKCSIQRYYYNNKLTKRIPVSTLELIYKYHKFRKEFLNEFGIYPIDEKIIEHLNITPKKLKDLRKIIQGEQCQSMNTILPGTDDITLEECVADEYNLEDDIVNKLSIESVNESLWNTVNDLDERSSKIINAYYKDNLTQEKISESLDISKARVQQIMNKSYRTLSDMKKIKNIAEFYGYDSSIVFHYGVNKFKNTFTSSTEYLALKRLEIVEQINKKHKCIMR